MVRSVSRAWQMLQKLSPPLTHRRKKQRVIVYPFEDDRATVWHRWANNEFSWEWNQSETQKSANTDAFHTSQNVHCVPAAFCIYSQKLKYPPFSRCSPVFLLLDLSLMNWRRWTRLPKEKKPKADDIAFPAPAAKKQQAGTAWGQCHPLRTIRHDRTKTLSWRQWFIPPSTGFPCFQALPVAGTAFPALKV